MAKIPEAMQGWAVSLARQYVGLGLLVVVLLLVLTGTGTKIQDIGLFVRGDRDDVVRATGAQVIRQDAAQRAILIVERGPNGEGSARACSEPPPDVAQNLAQTLNSSINALGRNAERMEAQAALTISADLKRTSEALFERSQGIQLLRDTMFRLCEGFQNGVLTSGDYRSLIQDLINTANFIIPFEQCMGIARAGSVAPGELVQKAVVECLDAAAGINRLRVEQAANRRVPFDECAAISREFIRMGDELVRKSPSGKELSRLNRM